MRRWCLAIAAGMLAGGGVAGAQISPACVATTAGVKVGGRNTTWLPPFDTYQYAWSWMLQWGCNVGVIPTCHCCSRVEVERYTGGLTQWVTALVINTPSWGSAACDQPARMSVVTTVTGLRFNTTYRAIWEVAAWNPALSGNCFGQDYVAVAGQKWVTDLHP